MYKMHIHCFKLSIKTLNADVLYAFNFRHSIQKSENGIVLKLKISTTFWHQWKETKYHETCLTFIILISHIWLHRVSWYVIWLKYLNIHSYYNTSDFLKNILHKCLSTLLSNGKKHWMKIRHLFIYLGKKFRLGTGR